MEKIALLTSGGDAPGMNCAIRSIVRYATPKGIKIIGALSGYQGLVESDFIELSGRSVSNIISRGGTILKTARSQDFFTKEGRKKVYDNLTKEKIDSFIVIGGDGSYRGAIQFHEEFNFPVVGIPGTIDNDINGTQMTLGFDTALNTAMDAIDKIKDTATSMDRIFLIEVMGRNSGAIAAHSALSGGAEDIIIPNGDNEIGSIIEKIDIGRSKGKKSWIIIVAEGAGEAKSYAELLGSSVANVRITVIGHIQRGGSPSAFDRFLGALMGKAAVDALLEGKNSHAIGWVNNQAIAYPLKEAAKPKNEDFSYLHELIHILT